MRNLRDPHGSNPDINEMNPSDIISYYVYKYGVYIIYCIYIYAYAYMYVYMYVYVYVSFEKYECEPTNFDIQVPMVGI